MQIDFRQLDSPPGEGASLHVVVLARCTMRPRCEHHRAAPAGDCRTHRGVGARIRGIMMISPLLLNPNGPVCLEDRIAFAELGIAFPPAAPQATAPRDPFAQRNAVRDVHVVPHAGSWAVKVERSPGYAALVPTQVEALGLAVSQARAAGVQLVLHGRDGRFREVYDYTR